MRDGRLNRLRALGACCSRPPEFRHYGRGVTLSPPDAARRDPSSAEAVSPGRRADHAQPGRPSGPPRAAGHSPAARATWIFTAVALVARGIQLIPPGGLLGVTEYDDGVYFGAALRLTQGLLPYRSFVFVQPPGLPLLMTPLALLAHVVGTDWGLAAARLLTVLVGAANVYLLGRLLRHRGQLAVVVGCGLLAVFPAAVMAAHTLLLGPYLDLACLAGFGLLFEGDELTTDRSRLLWAGVSFGLAGAIKAWAILPVLVILAVLALHRKRKASQSGWMPLGRFAGGVTVGFLVPCLPFLIGAPIAFVRDVVVDQILRTAPTRTPTGVRLSYLAGFVGGPSAHSPWPALLLTGAILVVGWGILGGKARRKAPESRGTARHSRPIAGGDRGSGSRVLDVTMAASAVVVFVAFLWPADFYYHYGAFFAPWLAASLGLAVGRLRMRLLPGSGAVARLSQVCGVVLVAAGATFLVARPANFGGPVSPSVDRLVPAGACVVTDQVSITIAANRFFSSTPGCPTVVDPFGTALAMTGGEQIGSGAAHSRRLQRFWRTTLERAGYVVLSSANTRRIPWSPDLRRLLRHRFRLIHRGTVTIWARRSRAS